MTIDTMATDTEQARRHFEGKLAFEIGPVELSHALRGNQKLQVIDLRAPEFFQKGHIPGAKNIPLENLDKQLAELNKETPVVVYCYNITCHLSTKAALELTKKGYRAKELLGGWSEWVNASQPVEGKSGNSNCSSSQHSCH